MKDTRIETKGQPPEVWAEIADKEDIRKLCEGEKPKSKKK